MSKNMIIRRNRATIGRTFNYFKKENKLVEAHRLKRIRCKWMKRVVAAEWKMRSRKCGRASTYVIDYFPKSLCFF